MHRTRQKMARLIDDLLDLSRVSRGTMRREPVDLSSLALGVAEALQQREPQRSVHWSVEPALSTHGDPHLLQIVMENLLGNAWKFSGKRDHASIAVGRRLDGARSAYFVQDNGAGFDMAYAHRLFGAFQRLHNERDFPGTGIGLVTVQRIIHRHGGSVWAEAAVDAGATFYFTLGDQEAAPCPQK